MKSSVIVTAGRLLNLEDCKRAPASGRFLQNEVLKSDIHLESFGAAKAGESSILVACHREGPSGAGSRPDKDGVVCMDVWLWGILESRRYKHSRRSRRVWLPNPFHSYTHGSTLADNRCRD
jgi:hypothetical protein